MTHLSINPQRRRYNALDALDKLVARECEAVQVVVRPTAPQEPARPSEDTAFIEGAVAYLAARPNAAELMADIDQRWKALKATADAPATEDADHKRDEPDGEGGAELDAKPEHTP